METESKLSMTELLNKISSKFSKIEFFNIYIYRGVCKKVQHRPSRYQI